MSQHIINFRGEECTLMFRPYHDGNTCIQLICGNGQPMCTATINIPEINTDPYYVVIKDYSENKGILEALEAAKVVQRLDEYAINAFGTTVWLCEILHGFKPYWTAFQPTLPAIAKNIFEPRFVDPLNRFSVN